jgi:hypothetical protein
MSTAAAALINWNELWKIVIAALVGGTGVVIVFGLLLLGISRVVAVAAVGIYAMTQKPSPAQLKPKPAAITLAPTSATIAPRQANIKPPTSSASTPTPER